MEKHMPKHGEFCWNELMTPDAEKAKEFYKKMFGWEYKSHQVNENNYNMVQAGGTEGGLMQIPANQTNQMPPHWMTYIYVNSVDEAVAKAENLGAKVTYPPTNAGDYGRFAILQDPTGAHVGLWQSLKSCC